MENIVNSLQDQQLQSAIENTNNKQMKETSQMQR